MFTGHNESILAILNVVHGLSCCFQEIGYSAAYVNFINMLKIANEGKFEEAATLGNSQSFWVDEIFFTLSDF